MKTNKKTGRREHEVELLAHRGRTAGEGGALVPIGRLKEQPRSYDLRRGTS